MGCETQVSLSSVKVTITVIAVSVVITAIACGVCIWRLVQRARHWEYEYHKISRDTGDIPMAEHHIGEEEENEDEQQDEEE
eukprot:NODE_3386_length_402_cov_374.334278_g2850_i0.p1 GENE.NODE_3386_length_402_cov_374.334278_g2850_i0~~NODE_3386_length_402_cov_374.334278_g2850_i0.p1  ORF type:complete len:81 (-),score=21.04 NODE_3386_length_402_cov_374.334278_g2850_i0:127-369(-)